MRPSVVDAATAAAVRKFVGRHRRFVIAFHRHPDGDALAGAFLLERILNRLGREALILSRDPAAARLAFLLRRFPDSAARLLEINERPLSEALPGAYRDACLVVIDSSNPGRTGLTNADLSLFSEILDLDHHSDNTRFGSVNCVTPAALSIGHLLFGLLGPLRVRLDRELAELVYVSLYSDTVGLSLSGTDPRTLPVLSELFRHGIGLAELNRELRRKSGAYLQLSGLVLSRLTRDEGTPAVLWSAALQEDLRATGLEYQDLDGIIDEMSLSAESGAVFLLKELAAGSFKASIRSVDGMNVKTVAAVYGGGGHDKAAGFEIRGTAAECAADITRTIRKS